MTFFSLVDVVNVYGDKDTSYLWCVHTKNYIKITQKINKKYKKNTKAKGEGQHKFYHIYFTYLSLYVNVNKKNTQ